MGVNSSFVDSDLIFNGSSQQNTHHNRASIGYVDAKQRFTASSWSGTVKTLRSNVYHSHLSKQLCQKILKKIIPESFFLIQHLLLQTSDLVHSEKNKLANLTHDVKNVKYNSRETSILILI